jgi:ParB family transcriptional regulator, chromosome partitioning protein
MSTLDFLKGLQAPQRVVEDLDIELLYPDPNQPRKSLQSIDGHVAPENQVSLEELAEDIANQGLHQPITVREDGQGRFIIIMGERRWRAFKLNRANGVPDSERIPAMIRHDLKDANLRLAQLAENLQREDLSDIEIATFLKAILEEYPELQKQQLGKILRKSPQWISRVLALLDPQWGHVVDSGIITYASLLEQFRALSEASRDELTEKAKAEQRSLTSGDIKGAREKEKAANGKGLVPPVKPIVASGTEALERLGVSPDVAPRDPKTIDFLSGKTDADRGKDTLDDDLLGAVQSLIASATPPGEKYAPPSQPERPAIKDFGGEAVIPAGLSAVNFEARSGAKRELKVTLNQIEVLLGLGVVQDLSHVATINFPVEEIAAAIKGLGGEVPEDDTHLAMALIQLLNDQ